MIRSLVTATQTKLGVLAESTELEPGQRITALRAIERERKTQQAISRVKMAGKVVMVMNRASGEVVFEKGKLFWFVMDAQIATNQLTPLGGKSVGGESPDQGAMSLGKCSEGT